MLVSGFLEVKASSGQGKASTALLRGAAWVWAGPSFRTSTALFSGIPMPG